VPKFIDQDTGKEFPLHPTPEWAADRAKLSEEVCRHEQSEVRRTTASNGSVQFGKQCLRCGAFVGNWIAKAKVPPNVPDADRALRDKYENELRQRRQEIDQKHIRIQRENGNLFSKRHQDYLASKSWAAKRAKVMKRANRLCEGCLDAEATVVHHLSYKSWGDELLFDLVALCTLCHAKCHPEKEEAGDAWVEPPCYACRYLGWDSREQMWCTNFGMTAMLALASQGLCGPERKGQEALK